MTISTRDRALFFHQLHRKGQPLVLPNAWDVASARIVEDAGAPAVATTSAGVAWALGAPDGDQLDRELAITATARVAAAVSVPVTADLESGFGATADEVADTIRQVVDAGVVGVNLEDALASGSTPLRPAEEQAERLAAARRAAEAANVPLYINARVDTYLRTVGDDPEARLQETLDRARTYLAAGASGIFVPAVPDVETVATLVREVDAPLNILPLKQPGFTVPELARLGVARISLGAGLAAAAYAVVRRSAKELLTEGTYTELAGALTHPEINALIARNT
ncbi:2-Methylisocitrate lyase, PEP mutase family [Streptoalloteichus tenebrarius]|uniref:2-Methylisocitrate lyase, PEP mutase family n=1 Tax=Streptoalloteichus tenebrarius (strain ATCC 17920 / DSM 40477 / JCM 4838 / CBS 697.72 / NBRC 16177 / NCIMB 11028 / NRRL B-12390 / A12253. 1 / ISP 5477) TaxID=1933 RepID=A0ABT1HWW3_STRSD|nr:isocitrate lyase/phosphoenolpyruvate mutase family protein [Streptoalloteichus tenebrarius]MCP2259990.1 2-Methylisocitrate lyase, PEP mutase family [Streptoalloteichus tenebrarius]BFF03897.1 isocitrate lyase/phosphoenolpyruvate mutase family protein [Streptoalloteichus tenebrarius]